MSVQERVTSNFLSLSLRSWYSVFVATEKACVEKRIYNNTGCDNLQSITAILLYLLFALAGVWKRFKLENPTESFASAKLPSE